MKNAIIEFSGGFHDSAPLRISVKLIYYARNDYPHYLSLKQKIKLSRHFCGISGCRCGGASRAKRELINYKLVPV